MTLKEACFSIPFLKDVSPATQSSLLSCGILKRCCKGSLLFMDKNEVDSFYFLISGTAALYKFNQKDDRKVIFICKKGEMLNEVMLQNEFASVNCELLVNSLVLAFPRSQFYYLMSQDFQLCEGVMQSMALKIRKLYHQLKNTANSTGLDKKIASKLWKLSRDHGVETEDGTEINFDLTISFLADLVGSKRETVSRQIKVLSEQGLLLIKRNRIVVLDVEGLQAYYKEEKPPEYR